MKMVGTPLDARCTGFARPDDPMRVSPVRLHYKWMPWRKPVFAWAVMQPKQEPIGRSMEWVWRHVAVFSAKGDAEIFLEEIQ